MIFARGLAPSEGPVLLADSSFAICQMAPPDRGGVSLVSADGASHRFLASTGRPNGMAVDARGDLWVAETDPPALVRVTLDGAVDVVLRECQGQPFLFPNDLCFGPDGALYFTDSGILFRDFVRDGAVRSDYLTCPVDGRIYRVEPRTRSIRKLESGGRFTNGIAFGPDGAMYTTETLTGTIHRYEWRDGGPRGKELFANVLKVSPEQSASIAGPDGMAFGRDGRLYVAVFGQGDVTVLSPRGHVLDRIPTESPMPTNVAFGPPGSRRIVVTEMARGEMETFEVGVDGHPLLAGQD